MAKHYKAFRITGVLNTTKWDAGLTSTEAIPKRLLGVLLNLSGYADNTVLGNVERKEFLSVPDYIIDTEADLGAANFPYSTTKKQYFEIDHELDVGKTFKIGILCGATIKNVRGVYVYEEV